MGSSRRNSLTNLFLIVLFSVSWIGTTTSSTSTISAVENTFLECMSSKAHPLSQIHTSQTSSYSSLLYSPSIQNLRLVTSIKAEKPTIILTPKTALEIRKALLCSKQNGLQIRVRSGGHDYEGLSSTSNFPFIIIDLLNYRSISIHLNTRTAWVQAGATVGELSYRINEKSKTLAFPVGTCPTMGVGGHFSGGGIGMLVRKYGIAADNIIDATILDVNGKILNRTSMGENLFWAIRGGSGASFGIILSWQIKLVQVPQVVTVFSPGRVLEQDATKLVMKWQQVADKLPQDLFIRLVVQLGTWNGKKTVQVVFNSLYLGGAQDLLKIMQQSFPELGLTTNDCKEMSWIDSVVNIGNYQQVSQLLDRTHPDTLPFKAKSDYVQKPVSQAGLEGLWKRVLEEEMYMVYIILEPFGGKMNDISEAALPFPHRKGNLYEIQYIVKWNQGQPAQKHIDWIRNLYSYMTPYVSSSPRAAYVNYRDLDLGKNNDLPNVNYLKATQWGTKYFKGNFKKLAMVKKEVDPQNYFNDEQSIPPFSASISLSDM
ncbi:berberine bridge enzyme-like 23 [Papaver somniferum]|uniref:berberine bridge enzyme-like 23 n=1 Tax=Papaver somniferum TaxID=3469 RepID=UPI000E6FC798|nr:berberine bridge enzyme-like 23 [Papaver somniferum]